MKQSKKKNSYLWIGLFCVLFLTPLLTYPLFRRVIPITEIQNRTYAARPEISVENYEKIAGQTEDYFEDNLPYRDALIYLNTIFTYEVFGQSVTEQVVVGEEDWLFYRESLADYKKTNLYSEEELLQIKNNLEQSQRYLEERGIEFIVFIGPNKATIYGEDYLPSYIVQQDSVSRTEQLVTYIRENTDITIIFPKEELLTAAKEYPQEMLYFKSDTHWNFLGGYIGAGALLKEMDIELPALKDVTLEKNTEPYFYWKNGYDMENMMGLTGYFKEPQNYQITGYTDNTVITEQDERRNYEDFDGVCRYYSDSENEQKLMFVRDSFATGMLPYITANFAEVYSPYQGKFEIESIDTEQPDIFVYEMVERADLLSFVLEE